MITTESKFQLLAQREIIDIFIGDSIAGALSIENEKKHRT